MTINPIKALLLLALLVLPFQAEAQQGQVIGVVDVPAILQNSAAGKNIQSQLDAKRNEYQKQISSKENALRDSEKKILEGRADWDEAEFNDKRKDFEEDVLEAQKLVQNNKRSLEAGFGRGLSKLRDEVRATIESIAKQRGYTMVLSQESVLIAEQSIDITDEVIAALDKKVSKIAIDWSTGN